MDTKLKYEMHNTDYLSAAFGFFATIAGMVIQWIPVQSLIEAVALASVGATASFFTTQVWKWIFKRIKNRIKN